MSSFYFFKSLYYSYLSSSNETTISPLRRKRLAIITPLIGIILFILYTIPSLVNLARNYRSFNKVITILWNVFFSITYLRSKGDTIALHPLLAI